TEKDKVHAILEKDFLDLADNGKMNLINGGNYIIRTNDINKTGWSLVAVISTQELLDSVELLQKSIIFLIITLLAFITIINFITNFAITKPIKELADAFDSVA